jgi:hypothetical protein
MGDRIPTAEEPDQRDQPVDPGPGQGPCPGTQPQEGTTLNIGPILARTTRHFFPDFDEWLDEIEDPRFLPFITYDKRFLLWWGLELFLCKLSSRRQLDYQLNTDGPELLGNLNRLAHTEQDSRPVNGTLEHFLGGIGDPPLANLQQRGVDRLIRMRALEDARLQGRYLVLIDGTGYLVFNHKHCDHCLTQQHGDKTVYMHQALEAKVLGPGGTVFSIGTEFIDNRDAKDSPPGASAERIKQDCELKALPRLMKKVRAAFPQLRICLLCDNLIFCGAGFQVAKDRKCDYIYVFKEGRTPALWREFQSLLKLCPDQRVEQTTPQGEHQVYRWVNELPYEDSDGRKWVFNAIQCEVTKKNGEKGEWAWVTPLKVNRETVIEVSTRGGRQRWREENEGFNTQKTSGLNLEHAYSHSNWAAYYFLLQFAHMLLQLVEKGSLLRHLAEQSGKKTAVDLFGSLKNMAQRLLDSLRYRRWPDEAFDAGAAGKIQIRLNSS